MVAECYRELKLENLPHFDLVVSGICLGSAFAWSFAITERMIVSYLQNCTGKSVIVKLSLLSVKLMLLASLGSTNIYSQRTSCLLMCGASCFLNMHVLWGILKSGMPNTISSCIHHRTPTGNWMLDNTSLFFFFPAEPDLCGPWITGGYFWQFQVSMGIWLASS